MESFYSDDSDVQKGIVIKQRHTRKVVNLCHSLATHLGLSTHDDFLARLIGLFHDVGRFSQFSIYKTFNDAKSENHALMGLKVLADESLLVSLPLKDQENIEFAIKNHNAREIEFVKDPRKMMFAKLIRDADKLDIFRVLRPYLTRNDKEPCSANFIAQFKNGGQCDYSMIRTQNDRKLVRLLWIYDINYSWTLKKVMDKGYVEEVIDSLPQTPDMKEGFAVLDKYIKEKLQQKDSA
nr:HD domain-containing protein [Pectinatus sottacetonis]